MNIDEDKIDECVLALMTLTFHGDVAGGTRAWKSYDWDVLDRLYKKGYIHDPVGKAKSVLLTEQGVACARRLFEQLFERS